MYKHHQLGFDGDMCPTTRPQGAPVTVLTVFADPGVVFWEEEPALAGKVVPPSVLELHHGAVFQPAHHPRLTIRPVGKPGHSPCNDTCVCYFLVERIRSL